MTTCGIWAAGIVLAVSAAGPLDWPETTPQCRPWAYHWWLGSAVDRENLTRELQRYREGGLGGVHIVPIYGAQGAEARYIPYLAPPWMEMLTFAVQEGQQQGVGVDMTTGTGWCFGGPDITPELGGRKLVVKQMAFPVAFPADGRLPDDSGAKPVTIQALVVKGPNGERREISDRLKPDGTVDWKPPTDGWTLYVLGHQFTGTMVKRAAPGGAGPMINPFSAEAMRKYLERFTAAFETPGTAKPRAMYHDSFEYFGANWSPDLPAEFARRRGYRIEDELEALAGQGDPDRVARVRCDVAETLSDMVVENVFPQWAEWCRQRGIKTRNQAHGAPANWLDFYAVADIPETEMFGHGGPDPLVSRFDEHLGGADRDPLICKFASSAAHVAGKPLTSAETGTWLAEHFCETFEELKCEIDLILLAGINHIFYHGCVYSPDDAAWPGWLFYASTQMNPRNPLWREAPALNEYVARCQAILREGLPDNDVLVYWPIHDAWTDGVGNMSVHNKAALKGRSLERTAQHLWERGYGFDYVSDRLLRPLQVAQGAVEGPGGATWRAIVVPPCRTMPHATLAKFVELAEQGATVVFESRLPEDVPGLGQLDERRAAFQRLRKSLDSTSLAVGPEDAVAPLREVRRGQGRLRVGALEEALKAAGVNREPLVDRAGLKFIRRRHDRGWHYFIANHAQEPLDDWVALATPARGVVVMDPMTGERGMAEIRPAGANSTEIRLRLELGHSLVLRTFEQEQIQGPAWTWTKPREVAVEINGPWQIEFVAGGPDLPKPFETSELRSWTANGDPATESFAGTAKYRCTFAVPRTSPIANPAKAKGRIILSLGEVKHVARVRLNGRDLVVLVMHPYRVAIPPELLQAEGNVLEVEVTNLAANRIRDLDRRKVPWRIFHEINFVNIGYRPFDASAWPVFESGLLGPVRIEMAE